MSNVETSFDVLTYPQSGETNTLIVQSDKDTGPIFEKIDSYEVPIEHISTTALEARIDALSIGEMVAGLTVISDTSVPANLIESGAGAVQAHNIDGISDSLQLMLGHNNNGPFYDSFQMYKDLSYGVISETLFNPESINIVGFLGRTGAGKSTSIRRLVESSQEKGYGASLFQVDSFFKMSRSERKAWLNEPGITDEELVERKRVSGWWDFDAVNETLQQIKAGKSVHLKGLYDMQQGGEKVGVMDVDPNPNGHIIFVEGTALLLSELRDSLDSLVYINMHDKVRAQSLMERNLNHGYTREESVARKELTDEAETNGHISQPLRAAQFLCGNLTVLDNSSRSKSLKLLPPFIPKI